MKGVKEIKARIGGVRDTLKITKAMYVLSAAKLPRCIAKLQAGKAYHQGLEHAVQRLMCKAYCQNPFLQGNASGRNTGWIVLAGDKGLCGDYNDRVLVEAWSRIAATDDYRIFAVGYMAKAFFVAKGVRVSTNFVHMLQNPLIEDAAKIADRLMDDLSQGDLKQVFVVYTMATHLYDHEVVCEQLVPLPYPMQEENVRLSSPDEDINELLHAALTAKIYCALLDASAALTYKHMSSMQQSAKNGEEMLEQLTQDYHHARQSAITTELTDVNVARTVNEDNP